jgi:hypothetical protein
MIGHFQLMGVSLLKLTIPAQMLQYDGSILSAIPAYVQLGSNETGIFLHPPVIAPIPQSEPGAKRPER